MKKNLSWSVFVENINSREIEEYNIFNHGRFYESLLRLKKRVKKYLKEHSDLRDVLKYREEISKDLDAELRYYFWAKCEWEIVLTSWPPFVTNEEIDRLQKERSKYNTNVELVVDKKIDVYSQIKLNWDIFLNYLWEAFFLK